MRKLKVNAQVTAMTSIIEAFGNILQWSIWIFITKFAGYGTLIQSILLYFVALPYVFLMNTSQNKERVIESGWFNVLKNTFGNGQKVMAISSWCQNYWKCNLPSARSKSQIVIISSRSKNVVDCVVQNPTIEASVRFANNDNTIYMSTVLRDQYINETENLKTLTINVPMDISTISNNFHQKRVFVDNRIVNNNIRTQSGRNSNASHLRWTRKRRELLKDLLLNISNDEEYIGSIKMFFLFEDSVRLGDNDFTDYCNRSIKLNSGLFLRPKLKEQYALNPLNSSRWELQQIDRKNQVKRKIREKMIKRLLRHYKDDENIYDHYLQKLLQYDIDCVI